MAGSRVLKSLAAGPNLLCRVTLLRSEAERLNDPVLGVTDPEDTGGLGAHGGSFSGATVVRAHAA